ncbi:hypothetical protein MINT15_25320 [Saccharomonospora viridis]|uniref:Uncharacterized protein n=1 Tax=Saccharomonospora viridis TaxID=1852 RepID=A0A837D840_9PSEU|nr:hypothetical protein MINT15_25320 [Saccharomonospora viridis]
MPLIAWRRNYTEKDSSTPPHGTVHVGGSVTTPAGPPAHHARGIGSHGMNSGGALGDPASTRRPFRRRCGATITSTL